VLLQEETLDDPLARRVVLPEDGDPKVSNLRGELQAHDLLHVVGVGSELDAGLCRLNDQGLEPRQNASVHPREVGDGETLRVVHPLLALSELLCRHVDISGADY